MLFSVIANNPNLIAQFNVIADLSGGNDRRPAHTKLIVQGSRGDLFEKARNPSTRIAGYSCLSTVTAIRIAETGDRDYVTQPESDRLSASRIVGVLSR